MEYKLNGSDIVVSLQEVHIDTVVGESAKMEVQKAVNYIQSGKAEIEAGVDAVLREVDEHVGEKTAEFDQNADDKTGDFNSNAVNKTNNFNTNAENKTTSFDENATNKTNAFNQNASDKISAFDGNASSKTNAFNQNATNKTGDFNTNATNKTTDFNDNYIAKKALIDAEVETAQTAATNASNSADLAKQWAIGDPTEPTGNSAKYWAEEADASETNAEIWAEGTDEEVQALGGVHSSKGWADQSAQGQVQSNWTEADPTSKAYILNKPTIPTVNNATLTIQKNGTTVNTFTANASSNVTANITVPTNTNELTNGAGFITGISSSDVTTALGYTPANDSDVVKTSGSQNISGIKKFANNHSLVVRNANVTKGTNPSAQQFWNIGFTDTNSADYKDRLGVVECYLNTDGSSQMQLKAYKNVAQSTTTEYIGITYPASGSAYTYAPTPATSDDSTKIATTAYVKSQGYALDSAVVKTSGNQTVGGVKTFSSGINIGDATEYKSQLYKMGGGSGNLALAINKQDNSGWLSSIALNKDGTIIINPSTSVSAPTPATGDNSTKIATTAFVNNWVTANTSEVAVVVEEEESRYHGWRVWSDGWVEQWGVTTINSANAWQDVSLYKPYATNIYQVIGSLSGTSTSFGNFKVRDYSLNTTTKFGLAVSSAGLVVRWYALGQGA